MAIAFILVTPINHPAAMTWLILLHDENLMNETKILVVDDDEKILFAFHEVLEKEGYMSLEAHDGTEALEKFAAEQPQVIIVDVVLPDWDGLELMRHLKQKNGFIPVIVITGQSTKHNEEEARRLGAFQYLTKPLSVAKVRETIRQALLSKSS